MLLLQCLIAFAVGMPIAWAWGKYLHYVQEGVAHKAALWDFVIIALTNVVTLSVWDISGRNPLVLCSYAIAGAFGTWMVVKNNERT
jgi:hypothetical protein